MCVVAWLMGAQLWGLDEKWGFPYGSLDQFLLYQRWLSQLLLEVRIWAKKKMDWRTLLEEVRSTAPSFPVPLTLDLCLCFCPTLSSPLSCLCFLNRGLLVSTRLVHWLLFFRVCCDAHSNSKRRFGLPNGRTLARCGSARVDERTGRTCRVGTRAG